MGWEKDGCGSCGDERPVSPVGGQGEMDTGLRRSEL